MYDPTPPQDLIDTGYRWRFFSRTVDGSDCYMSGDHIAMIGERVRIVLSEYDRAGRTTTATADADNVPTAWRIANAMMQAAREARQ